MALDLCEMYCSDRMRRSVFGTVGDYVPGEHTGHIWQEGDLQIRLVRVHCGCAGVKV